MIYLFLPFFDISISLCESDLETWIFLKHVLSRPYNFAERLLSFTV